MRRATTEPTGHPVVARLAAELTDELGALTDQLVTMLRKTDPSYLAVDIEDLVAATSWKTWPASSAISPASDRRALLPR